MREVVFVWSVTQEFNVATSPTTPMFTPHTEFYTARDFNELLLKFKYIGNITDIKRIGLLHQD